MKSINSAEDGESKDGWQINPQISLVPLGIIPGKYIMIK